MYFSKDKRWRAGLTMSGWSSRSQRPCASSWIVADEDDDTAAAAHRAARDDDRRVRRVFAARDERSAPQRARARAALARAAAAAHAARAKAQALRRRGVRGALYVEWHAGAYAHAAQTNEIDVFQFSHAIGESYLVSCRRRQRKRAAAADVAHAAAAAPSSELEKAAAACGVWLCDLHPGRACAISFAWALADPTRGVVGARVVMR